MSVISSNKQRINVKNKLYSGQLNIHAWVYKIKNGGVYVYSTERCYIKADHEEERIDTSEETQSLPLPV